MYKGHEIDSPAELESQFILRLPEEPARALREAIRSNSTLKDRLTIKIENDMRHGEVRVDHWLLPAKILDMPTIIESLKTIDAKGFYKTADICQIMICKEEDDQTTTDEESPQKAKRRDPNKVEKKYLMPHGITPPAKNIRKRRFRKTLKKKYVEAPEIEKEVKRLFRIDNDAVSVRWETMNEDDENKVNKGTVVKKEPVDPPNQNIAEHDIFGGAVSSDSEEEETHLNVLELDENSHSAEDSHFTDSNSMMLHTPNSKLLTEFTSDMFREVPMTSSARMMQEMENYQQSPKHKPEQKLNRNYIIMKLEEVEATLATLKIKRQQREMEIENTENIGLKQRFQHMLDLLVQDQIAKEQEKYSWEELLKQHPE